jgi:hypothetical protein
MLLARHSQVLWHGLTELQATRYNSSHFTNGLHSTGNKIPRAQRRSVDFPLDGKWWSKSFQDTLVLEHGRFRSGDIVSAKHGKFGVIWTGRWKLRSNVLSLTFEKLQVVASKNKNAIKRQMADILGSTETFRVSWISRDHFRMTDKGGIPDDLIRKR